MIDAIRAAARPLLAQLPSAAWLPHEIKRKADGKLDKPPCMGATTADPSTWRTIDDALKLLSGHNKVAGVGFAITRGLIGLDFDHCRDAVTGELTPEVQGELERLNSFAYVTPSKTGIRIMGLNPFNVVSSGKQVRVLPGGHKIEIFVGPTNHYNTFTADVIPGYETLRDISNDVSDYLSGLPGGRKSAPEAQSNPTAERSIGAIRAALAVIPNAKQDWDHWSYIGMAVHRSSGGSEEGREAFRDWSAKNPCHDDAALDERWNHWHRSPSTKLTFGTLYYLARKERPLFVPPFDAVEPDPDHIDGPDESPSKSDKPKAKIRLLSIADIEAMEDPRWMVDGLVPEKSLVVPYGPPKKGKTFIGLSMGLHIAANMDWAGKKVVGGGVIYIAGEGVGGLKLRLKAMRSHYGISDRIPFFFITKAVNFSQPGIVAELVQAIRDHVLDEPISLVVIDTLARAMPGVDENSSQEIGLVIAACDELKDALDCAVMPIHHTGKDADKGMRGSSAILGAVDAAFLVNSTGSTLTLTPTAQKDAELGAPIVFDMVTVPVGIGRTSLVPVLRDGPITDEEAPKTTRLNGTESIAMRALLNALTDHGCMLGTWGSDKGIPNISVCKDDEWREAFRKLMPAENADSVSRSFRRVVRELIDKKIVGACAPYVWSSNYV